MKFVELPPKISKNIQVSNFMEICPVGAELVPAYRQRDRQTYMTKLIVALSILRTSLKMIVTILYAAGGNSEFQEETWRCSLRGKGKGKAVPLQAWTGPEGFRKLRFPDFMTTAQDGGKVVSLTHRPPLLPGNTPGTHFC